MAPSLWITLCWLLFSGTHIGLAAGPVREPLVRRLGERGFTLLFSSVAALCFALLAHVYSRVRFAGAAGPGLGEMPAVGAVLGLLVGFGVVLMLASFATYASSPMSAAGATRVREPRGLERITRHPFFAGIAIFGLAHAALSTRLVGAVFFGALVLHASLGAWHQDRKLSRRRGPEYDAFVAATSAVPFGAVLAGRQRLVWSELPWAALAGGAALAVALRFVHASIFDLGGLYVIAPLVGGAGLALAGQWRSIPRRADAAGARAA